MVCQQLYIYENVDFLSFCSNIDSKAYFNKRLECAAPNRWSKYTTNSSKWLCIILTFFLFLFSGACSSRSTPKPRPPSQGTMRPNITFQTYACPPAYAAWYCLNGATCFTVKIADSILYNCE